MRLIAYDENWPESWKLTHHYDEIEIGGDRRDLGYTYQYRLRHGWSVQNIGQLVPAGGEIPTSLPQAEILRWRLPKKAIASLGTI